MQKSGPQQSSHEMTQIPVYTQGMPKEVRGPIVRFKTCNALLCVLEQ